MRSVTRGPSDGRWKVLDPVDSIFFFIICSAASSMFLVISLEFSIAKISDKEVVFSVELDKLDSCAGMFNPEQCFSWASLLATLSIGNVCPHFSAHSSLRHWIIARTQFEGLILPNFIVLKHSGHFASSSVFATFLQ